ncbi:MAG: RpoL/Rpb11 RNA polymerase subunit family protein [Candidatus Pacearchaeota archaeon]
MEIKVIKEEKNELEIEMDNVTIAEILRVYLHKDSSVEFAAWRRDHPSKPVILRIETKNKSSNKALEDAISSIMKDTDRFVSEVKSAIK